MTSQWPSFRHRAPAGREMMDDFSIVDERLERALEALIAVNRWLGGFAATRRALRPALEARDRVTLLDLGTGIADHPAHLVRWADRKGIELHVVAVDANPAVVRHARRHLDRTLSQPLRGRISVQQGDALALSFEENTFDLVHAALFMHHLDRKDAVTLLREMQRLGRYGLVVNDLHRHPLAYVGIKLIGAVFSAPPMFRHDGPISVLRGYRRDEMKTLARQAGLRHYSITWRWAFRWVLSTVRL